MLTQRLLACLFARMESSVVAMPHLRRLALRKIGLPRRRCQGLSLVFLRRPEAELEARCRIGHQLAEQVEQQVLSTLPNTNIVTHIEPVEDPISLEDAPLDREAPSI